jgi:flagella basal body P-ring formation protein FlgA
LGDLADIHSADEDHAKKLAAIPLFPAPGAGQRRFLRLHEVLEVLELRSIDLIDCRVGGASLIAIHGPQPAPPPLEALPKKEPSLPKEAAPSAPPVVKAEPVVFAVAAARPLERGQLIQPSDVQLASFPAKAARDGLLHEVELAVGYEATRPLTAGQPIEAGDLRKPILVRRREAVRVAVIAPGVRLAIDAIAHEEGSEGDWIAIQTPHSPEKIRARVCGLKRVEVYAGGAEPQEQNNP